MYWEDPPGRSRPAYLDLCLETVLQHAAGLEVVVASRADARAYASSIETRLWERLASPVQRSDVFRTAVLREWGGLWLDIDVLVYQPLTRLIDLAEAREVSLWGAEVNRVFTNLIVAPPGASVLQAWSARQEALLDSLPPGADAAGLGYAALGTGSVPDPTRPAWGNLPMTRVAPVPWFEWHRFLSPLSSPAPVLAAHPVTVMLWNAALERPLHSLTRTELLGGRRLLSRLFRIALGLSSVERESSGLARLSALDDLRFGRLGRAGAARGQRMASLVGTAGRRRGEPRR